MVSLAGGGRRGGHVQAEWGPGNDELGGWGRLAWGEIDATIHRGNSYKGL